MAPISMSSRLPIFTTLLAALPGAGGGGVAQPASRARANAGARAPRILVRMERLRPGLFAGGNGLGGGGRLHLSHQAVGEYLVANGAQGYNLVRLVDLELHLGAAGRGGQQHAVLTFGQTQTRYLGVVRQGAPGAGVSAFDHGRGDAHGQTG